MARLGCQSSQNRHLAPGRSEDAAVGQQRDRILRIRAQSFIGDKQECPIFAERESERASKLLAIQRILNRCASGHQTKVCEAWIESQRGSKGEGVARIQGVVAEETIQTTTNGVGA